MVERIGDSKPLNTRTDVKETITAAGDKEKVESIFINEKLNKRTTSLDKNNDGTVDCITTEKFFNSKISSKDIEYYDEKGRITEKQLDMEADGKIDTYEKHKYNNENNTRRIEVRDGGGDLKVIRKDYYKDGKIIKTEIDGKTNDSFWDHGPDGKPEFYYEYTHNDAERSTIVEKKNLNGEIETRHKTFKDENGNLKAVEHDKNLDGIFEERWQR